MTTKYLGDGIWAKRTNIDSSDIMLPIERQGVHAEVIQTHNAVSIGASASSYGDMFNCDGFSEISVHSKSDASKSNYINVYWSFDGINEVGADYNVATGSTDKLSATVPVRAPFARVRLSNMDTVAHTFSAWAYLKA